MKIPTEEYRKVIKCLKNYEYYKKKVIEIEADILGVSVPPLDSQKVSSGISDTVFNKLMELEEDKERRSYIKKCKIVDNVLLLVDDTTISIFIEEFKNKKKRWQIISDLNISESTYERRKRELIYTTYEELKKIDGKLTEF